MVWTCAAQYGDHCLHVAVEHLGYDSSELRGVVKLHYTHWILNVVWKKECKISHIILYIDYMLR